VADETSPAARLREHLELVSAFLEAYAQTLTTGVVGKVALPRRTTDIHAKFRVAGASDVRESITALREAALAALAGPAETPEEYERSHKRVIERIAAILLPNQASWTADEIVDAAETLARGAIRFHERRPLELRALAGPQEPTPR